MPALQSTADSLGREGSGTLAAGRYQGARSRRVTRCIMAVWLGLIFTQSSGFEGDSIWSELRGLAVTLVVVAIIDLWFSWRMGLTINERGITLHYAFRRQRVPWSKITGFEWRRWLSPSSEWVWITRDHGAPVRIPTIQRAPGGDNKRSLVSSFLASSNLRTMRGEEVDAMATLQDALETTQG